MKFINFSEMVHTPHHSWSSSFDVSSSCNIFSDKRQLLVDIGRAKMERNTAINIKLTILNLVIPVMHGASSCDISQGVMLNSSLRDSRSYRDDGEVAARVRRWLLKLVCGRLTQPDTCRISSRRLVCCALHVLQQVSHTVPLWKYSIYRPAALSTTATR
jgi:hypothetical protein